MSKILTDKECADIILQVVHGTEIDCQDAYMAFLQDLGALIAKHFGGKCSRAVGYDPNDKLGYTVAFSVDENVPADGGIFKKYDTDVEWKDGEEIEV